MSEDAKVEYDLYALRALHSFDPMNFLIVLREQASTRSTRAHAQCTLQAPGLFGPL